MVDISPESAFLVALNNAFNAARANAPQGNLGAGIPSLQAGSSDNGPGSPGSPAAISIGGGVPGTATTGQGIANALTGGAAVPATAESQSVRDTLLSRNPNTFGEDMGANPGGGNLKLLLSVLTGNPLLMAGALAAGVSGQGADQGPFPEPGVFPGTGVLFSDRDTGQTSFRPSVSSPLGAGTPNRIREGRIPGVTGPTVSTIRTGPVPSLNALNRDRDRGSSGGPGPGLSRGTGASNAGR